MSLQTQHDPKNEAEITYWNSGAFANLRTALKPSGRLPGRDPAPRTQRRCHSVSRAAKKGDRKRPIRIGRSLRRRVRI
jgi:hypothetical protein